MVVVFVIGFAFLGVGSGGLDLQSLVQSVFGAKGSSGPSLETALKNVQLHPQQAAAYKELADAYDRQDDTAQTIAALQQYVRLAPKDISQLQRLGGLELAAATTAQQALQLAFFRQQTDGGNTPFSVSPTSTSPLSTLVGPGQITQAVAAQDSTALNNANTAYETSAKRAIQVFRQLSKVSPTSTNLIQLANVAEQLGDAKTALTAYQSALGLKDVDPATKREIESRIATLEKAQQNSGG